MCLHSAAENDVVGWIMRASKQAKDGKPRACVPVVADRNSLTDAGGSWHWPGEIASGRRGASRRKVSISSSSASASAPSQKPSPEIRSATEIRRSRCASNVVTAGLESGLNISTTRARQSRISCQSFTLRLAQSGAGESRPWNLRMPSRTRVAGRPGHGSSAKTGTAPLRSSVPRR